MSDTPLIIEMQGRFFRRHRWQFSLRTLLVITTALAILVALAASFPRAAILIAIVAATLLFLVLAIFFAVGAVFGFWRFWQSFDAEAVNRTGADEDEPDVVT
jgi:hypothetical protein